MVFDHSRGLQLDAEILQAEWDRQSIALMSRGTAWWREMCRWEHDTFGNLLIEPVPNLNEGDGRWWADCGGTRTRRGYYQALQ